MHSTYINKQRYALKDQKINNIKGGDNMKKIGIIHYLFTSVNNVLKSSVSSRLKNIEENIITINKNIANLLTNQAITELNKRLDDIPTIKAITELNKNIANLPTNQAIIELNAKIDQVATASSIEELKTLWLNNKEK